jgi:antitoxin VapB
MATARVFKSGNSQAVRLPKDFRVDVEELEIFRRDDEIVLRPKAPDMRRAIAALQELSALIELPDDPPPEPLPSDT